MLKIGVTGNIGAGKTQVCQIFELLDIPVYYADPRAKSLMVEDELLVHAIKSLLGEKAYLADGQLDRKYISDIVFKDKEKLNLLNGLVHPAVARDFNTWSGEQGAPYCIKEAALLFEAGSYKQLNKTILVVADEEVRLKRVLARDGVPEEQIRARMANQMSQEEKIKLADYILDNNGEKGLVKQVLALHQQLLA